MVVLHLSAKNDGLGRPRRCYVCINRTGRIVRVVNEGFRGVEALYAAFPKLRGKVAPIDLSTTPRQIRELVKGR